MKGIRSFVGLLAALAAVTALGAGSASAAEYEVHKFPEIGRCVPTAVGKGTFVEGVCQYVARPGKGKYEWHPVEATEKYTFTAGFEATKLATLGFPAISCIGGKIAGEWVGPNTAKVVIELEGCKNQVGQQCQTPGSINKAEIASPGLTGELGFIVKTKIIQVGMDLKPPFLQTALFEYECGGNTTEDAFVEGSVIARLHPIQRMSTESDLVFAVRKGGAQNPEKFEGEPKDTLTTKFTKNLVETIGEKPSNLAMLHEAGTQSAPLEIRIKEVKNW